MFHPPRGQLGRKPLFMTDAMGTSASEENLWEDEIDFYTQTKQKTRSFQSSFITGLPL
jgi:hypothetical protein